MSKTLWDLKPGESGRLTGFRDGLPTHYQQRLTEVGFHRGETVTCLLAPGFGAPHVYRVSNSVFSLDDRVAAFVDTDNGHSV